MTRRAAPILLAVACALCVGGSLFAAEREEVVFWHFWGGRDRPVVERIVAEFNQSQEDYRVRAVAMPGANLDLKFFLSVTGGDPPDLLNHDDPVVADWAARGLITPLEELATAEEIDLLESWLFPAARELGSYEQQLFALPNGLDIRALYCNKTLLAEHGLDLPRSIADLDRIAAQIAPPGDEMGRKRMGFLPDPRRIWAWGIVFGGEFATFDADGQLLALTPDDSSIVAALEWMQSYSRRYGESEVAAFRSGEQALTGAAFPLLADRRYAVVMDGQWRTRDIAEAAAAAERLGTQPDEFAVVSLPTPPAGVKNAGWVNGNFFVVPRGARRKEGAWRFMKFWTGFGGHEAAAAGYCAVGGWIPASPQVVEQPDYAAAIQANPLLRTFVELAASPSQRPVPSVPIAAYYYQEVVRAAQEVMYRGADPAEQLQQVSENVQRRLQEFRDAR